MLIFGPALRWPRYAGRKSGAALASLTSPGDPPEENVRMNNSAQNRIQPPKIH